MASKIYNHKIFRGYASEAHNEGEANPVATSGREMLKKLNQSNLNKSGLDWML